MPVIRHAFVVMCQVLVGKLPIVWYDVAFMTINVSAQLASVIYGLRFIFVLKVPIFSYKFIDLGHELTYFLKVRNKRQKCYTENEVIYSMLKLLINNIFVEFGGNLSRQIISIPMGTNFASLLDDIFLYSYEAEFIQKRIKDNNKKKKYRS